MFLQNCSDISLTESISDVIHCCYHHCVSHRCMSHHHASHCCMSHLHRCMSYCYRCYTNYCCYMSYYCYYTSCFVNYYENCSMSSIHYPSYCCPVNCFGLQQMTTSLECCWDDCKQNWNCCYESYSDERMNHVSYQL